MARTSRVGSNDKALVLLTGIIVGLAVVGVLYWARVVLIPVALAIFLTFLLNPIVMQLQRWRLPRLVAVIAVSALTACLILGIGWLVVSQITGLVSELPSYQANIKNKIESIDAMSQNSVWPRIEAMYRDLSQAAAGPKYPNTERDLNHPQAQQPVPVVVEQIEPFWLRLLPSFLGPLSEFLGQAALVIVLVIFALLAREDLRNRFIRLVGHGRLTITTKAVDDASQRLSRFLLSQLTINVCFGICVAVGLALIGVQYFLLWGFLGAILRFVPYFGSPIAALFPIVLSIAQFDTWVQPALVTVLILGLELIAANVVEPLIFGRSIGVSAVALLIAAAFWAFLWGPIGLVLSCPLTVCLVVLGKYVPHLSFLTVMLGDEPALDEDFTYYQRLSARDEDEASDILLEYVKNHPNDDVYDSMLIPSLTYAGRDLLREGLDEDDMRFIESTTRDMLGDIGIARLERRIAEHTNVASGDAIPFRDKVRILGVPARNQSDEIALEMLRQLLTGEACEMKIAGSDVLASELLTMVDDDAPAVVCIAALPPGGLARARLLCKRLRSRFPELRLLVGRWGLTTAEEKQEKALREAGADHVRTTLLASRDDLLAWLPALAEKTADASANRIASSSLETSEAAKRNSANLVHS